MDGSISRAFPSSFAWRKSARFDKKGEAGKCEPGFSTLWKQEAFRMHLRCGGIEQAEKIFRELDSRDAIQFTLLISALVKAGRHREAVAWFQRMQLEGKKADRVCFMAVLSAYGGIGSLDKARTIHGFLYRCGYEADIRVGTSLVTLYAKCGSLRNARLMFGRLPHGSLVAWNAIITAYTQSGYVEHHFREVLGLFRQMCLEGSSPNQVTFVSVLNACIAPFMAGELRRLHGLVKESGFQEELIVQTALVKAYGRANLPGIARSIFDEIVDRDIVAWNTMVAAYEAGGHFYDAVQVFWQMQGGRSRTNRITFAAVFRACAGLRDLRETTAIHGLAIDLRMEEDEDVQAELLDAYLACGSPEGALAVFHRMERPSIRSWSTAVRVARDFGTFRLMLLAGAASLTLDEDIVAAALRVAATAEDAALVRACASEAGLRVI